jgi:asparagine synthase (glutamine-hydrolysing)
MCGIAAIFSRNGQVAPATIERATRSLYHRGPDGQRHWLSDDGRVALGHARLSIIDLTTGDQPISSEDEQTRIIVNGEFYGFEAIQQELERDGHPLRTRSDSEIALHLYDLLDRIDTTDEGSRVANDQVLLILVSACILQERFALSA